MAFYRLRYILPVVLISLCLVALSTITAVSLFSQQSAITRVLRENVRSQRAAVELEDCLLDVIALEDNRVETVAVLHDRVLHLMQTLQDVSDQLDEKRLHGKISKAFAGYLLTWSELPPLGHAAHELDRKAATRLLESEVLKPCQEFEIYNALRVEQSAEHHEQVLRQLAWGMGGIGLLGGIAGLLLGFGLARGLARSIRRLHIQLRDAAGKLGPDMPELVLTEVGDFRQLHAEVEELTRRIEDVVRELQQRELEVLRAEQLSAVGQLAAGVAHEVRNPLTSIKMLVQVGLNEPGGVTQEDLRVIDAEVRRMEASLNRFLDFARPQKSIRKPTPLLPLLEDVFDLIRPRADKQLVTVAKLDATAIDVLIVDAEQLRQVLVNVCLNALDAMPNGGTLSVRVNRDRKRIGIEVTDTGPGLAAAIVPRLFQPFASTKDTGLGLGLVISKRIVEEHGGSITAANRLQGGASFLIRLPREKGDGQTADGG